MGIPTLSTDRTEERGERGETTAWTSVGRVSLFSSGQSCHVLPKGERQILWTMFTAETTKKT